MKKSICILITICAVFSVFLTSCDSLWGGQGSTDVSFALNLDQYITPESISIRDSQNPSPVAVVPGGEDLFGDDDIIVTVSIHKTIDNSIIDSVNISLEEAQNTNVSFKGIPLRNEVYAKIEVIEEVGDDDNVLFTARTLDTKLLTGTNTLIAKPSVMYVSANGVGYSGSVGSNIQAPNYNQGRTYEDVLDDVYKHMSIDGTLVPGAIVYNPFIGFSVGDETWDFPGLTIKRMTDYPLITIGDSVSGAQSFVLKNITIDGGSIDTSSPVILVQGSSSLTINDGTVIQNGKNSGNGGGVSVDGAAATFTMNGGIIRGNTAANGGGVYVSGAYSDIFNANGGSITGNTAANGGGLYTDQDIDSSLHTHITHNTATVAGGGVYINGGGTLTLDENSVISHNTSGADGGGVFEFHGLITMQGGDISHNTSGQRGGGIYLTNTNRLTMSEGSINGNTSLSSGGGIYANGLLNINGGSIINNIVYSPTENNRTGGGIRITDGASDASSIRNVIISGNRAYSGVANDTSSGGGISQINGSLTLSNTTISNNYAACGGGLSIAKATLFSGSITRNTAIEGGGVYVGSMGTFTLQGGSLTRNSATNGGGVYLPYSFMGDEISTLTVTGGSFYGNTASENGSGVYRENSACTINDSSNIISTSTIYTAP